MNAEIKKLIFISLDMSNNLELATALLESRDFVLEVVEI